MHSLTFATLPLLLAVLAPWGSSSSFAAAALPKCYFPNGNEIHSTNLSTTYEPCNDLVGATSQCCATDQGCSANGLCISKQNWYSRGGCTDPTFQSPFCVAICTSILQGGTPSKESPVHQCSNGTWCCGYNSTTSTCCANGEGVALPATIGIDKGDSAAMSNTVKVSIGAGIGAAILISLGIVGFIAWRRRQQRKREFQERLAILSPTRSDHGLIPFYEEDKKHRRKEMIAKPKAARLSG